jgi:integrase
MPSSPVVVTHVPAAKVEPLSSRQTWWCWFRDHRGKQVRKSTHQEDRALAHLAALRIQDEYFASPPEYERVTIELALARYLAKCERSERAEGTMTQYVSKARQLLRVLGPERSINELRLSHVEQYIDERQAEIKRIRPDSTRSIATVGKELGLLRSALRYMAKQRGPDGFKLYRYDTDEIFPEGVIGNYKPRDRALSISEYHALYIALPPERREYLQAFCGLGTRDSELYRITPADIEPHAGRVRIPGTKTEAAERWLHPPTELFEILMRRSEVTPLGQPVFPHWLNVRRALEAACRRAGIPRVSPNDLRRTFASWQAEAGVPEAITASLMGHTSSQMVRRVYGRIGSDAKREALAKLPPLAPPPGVMLSVINEGAKRSAERQERRLSAPSKAQKPREKRGWSVPRDRIELPTRGFSVPRLTLRVPRRTLLMPL